MSVTLPHEREILGIVELAVSAYEKPFLAVVITDHEEHRRWIIQKLHDATRWDSKSDNVKLFREGIETKEGARIVIKTAVHPESLMGLRPDRIILMGRLGEMYYWLKTMDCEIEAIA